MHKTFLTYYGWLVLTYCACTGGCFGNFQVENDRIELQSHSGIRELTNVNKLRPVLFIIVALIVIVIFPLSVMEPLYPSIVPTVYNAAYGVILLILIGLYTFFGWKITKIFKRIYSKTKVPLFKDFLGKVIPS